MENLIDLLPHARQHSSTEFCCTCPKCGGIDKFIILNNKNRYFCQHCQIKGDVIQYLREFQDLSFEKSVKLAGRKTFSNSSSSFTTKGTLQRVVDKNLWSTCANKFYKQCLMDIDFAFPFLSKRFISKNTAISCGLGWNDKGQYFISKEWGVEDTRKLHIPQGLLVANSHSNEIHGLSVLSPADFDEPKYWQVKGSSQPFFVLGKSPDVFFILKSALDAILLYQESFRCGVDITVVALYGSMKWLDRYYIELINKASATILVPDNDLVETNNASKLLEIFPKARAILAGKQKNLGELAQKFKNSHVIASWLSEVMSVENKNYSCEECLQWRKADNKQNQDKFYCIFDPHATKDMICSSFIHKDSQDW